MQGTAKVFHRLSDLAFGLSYPDGNTVGRQIVGRGGAVFNHLTPLATDNGKGKTGPGWTVGAQMVEVEFDRRECSYRLIRAATVMDVGKAVDPSAYEGLVRGGMSMGLSLAREETLHYGQACDSLSTSFRTYKLLHIGQEPRYLVGFVETPQLDAAVWQPRMQRARHYGMPGGSGKRLVARHGQRGGYAARDQRKPVAACTEQTCAAGQRS